MKNRMLALACAAMTLGCAAETVRAAETDWTWYEKDALQVKGRAFADGETYYCRLPARTKGKVRPQIWEMCHHATGMFVRFKTDATKIRLDWKARNADYVKDALIPPAGLLGIDVYRKTANGWEHKGNNRYVSSRQFYAKGKSKKVFGEAEIDWKSGDEGLLLLPIRAEITALRVGVPTGCRFEPVGFPKGREKPVVHYGTSIVHGGCASRAGLTFTSIAQRELDRDYVNLGFSGNGVMDLELVPFLAEIDAALYVVDCAWNMGTSSVQARAAKFLKELHRLKPGVPILLCEGCNSTVPRLAVNDALRKVYDELVRDTGALDGTLHYLAEEDILVKGDHEQTHDFCHPNDLGNVRMGRAFAKRIAEVLDARTCCPMPPQTAEEALDLAERTYAYVAKRVPAAELAELRAELDLDAKWLRGAKSAADRRNAEREIRSVRRRILFRHPDLQFKRLLAVQRGLPFSQEAGTADQNAGRWSSAGPGLIALDNWQTAPHKTVLLDGKLPKGCTLNPDLHWDADRIVFAFNDHTRAPEADPKAMGAPPVVAPDNKCRRWIASVDPGNPNFDAPDAPWGAMHHRYFLYECAADGSWVRQLTGTPSDPMKTWEDRQTLILEDADPCYLPDGGILFHSTRSQTFARCHAGRYVPAWLLYRMNGDGSGIRQLSWGEANEWEPTVLNDGTICYTRWDYINRHAMWFSSLWTTRPDGTAVAHYYGNYSKTIFTTTEAKAIPGSTKIVATASAHHMFNAGSLVIIDTAKGEDGEKPLTRLTPDTDFPEACNGNGPDRFKVTGLYKDAMPVNDTLFFATYSPETLWYPNGHPRQRSHGWTGAWPHPRSFGIWLVDTLGGRELIYQDWEWGTFNPIPLVKRPKPPALASVLPPRATAPAVGYCYVENVYDSRVDLPPGSVKALRVNRLYNQGAAKHFSWNNGGDLDIYKESLGTVPVAADGSASFTIPAELPIQLQALDGDGKAILTMRSFIYAQKGEIQGCVGCHEQKNRSGATASSAAKRKGKPLDPVPEIDLGYRGPFSYVRSVQPIFDRKCIACHGLGKAKTLIGEKGLRRVITNGLVSIARSYRETVESKPYDYFAAASPLLKRIDGGHGPKLTPEERKTLILWMDYNVPEYNIGGGYAWDRPELRETDPAGERALRAAIAATTLAEGDAAEVAKQPFEALVNRGDETKSRILWLVKPEDRARFLALVKNTLVPHAYRDLNGTCGRPVGEPCRCNSCWVRRGGFNRRQPPPPPAP